jgi:hypothetical protein
MSERNKKCLSFPVLGDQKGNMYKFMKGNTDGQVLLNDVAGGACVGVLDTVDGDATGKVVPVAYEGVVRVLLGATVAKMALVASTNTGLATTATGGDYVQGLCIVGGDSGDLGEVLLYQNAQLNA